MFLSVYIVNIKSSCLALVAFYLCWFQAEWFFYSLCFYNNDSPEFTLSEFLLSFKNRNRVKVCSKSSLSGYFVSSNAGQDILLHSGLKTILIKESKVCISAVVRTQIAFETRKFKMYDS